MFWFGFTGFKLMREIPEGAMTVKATGRTWSWLFEYENGKKDKILRLPRGRPVRVAINSEDVLHSLFIPAFRLKEDAVPGFETNMWFEARETGEFDIFCAEYCGAGHSRMLSKAIVMPPDEFDRWYAKRPPVAVSPGELLEQKGCLVCHTTDGSRKIGPGHRVHRRRRLMGGRAFGICALLFVIILITAERAASWLIRSMSYL